MYISEQENGVYNEGVKTRSLLSGRYIQSAIRLDDPDELYLRYTKFFTLGPALVPDAKTVLMLGGGGMSVPKWFLADTQSFSKYATMDVVEIDPLMTEVAKKHFFFKDSERVTVYHEDGRIFLNRNTKKYDIVFIDVFKEGTVPFHLMTVEAMTHIRNALTENGVICMNCIAALDSLLFARIHTTLTNVFSNVKVFYITSQEPDKEQNIMLLAGQKNLELQDNPFLANEYNYVAKGDIEPLTDNFAPVDL
ncbi:MAG: fused MFS/spermidine synthase [Desulfovibrionaceae bacterium]|nr:fused MFS/spermidine synthase [Desulfovibrionaceae bacterium]